MRNWIKRISVLLILLIVGFGMVGCDKEPKPTPPPLIVEVKKFIVTFDSEGGSEVAAIEVEKDKTIAKPENPTKAGFDFEYWYLEAGVAFDFATTPITSDITLKAAWIEQVAEPTTLEKIEADYQAVLENFIIDEKSLNVVTTGPVNKSRIVWKTQTPHISNSGIILPLFQDETPFTGVISATFRLAGETATYDFEVPIDVIAGVRLETSKSFLFENLTTEYEVSDAEIDLWFESDGTVPYVNVENFFNLIKGFIDPEVEFTFTVEAGVLTIFYQYYDEEEDHTYDLKCVIDSVNQTITTPDPGFYWAYVYSTETNYGRHIEYLRDHAGSSSVDGNDLVYDLKAYNLEIANHNNELLLPFSLVNQLFAGSSYYNVYYNGDKLYGIYSLPSAKSREYNKMKTSSLNDTTFSPDLIINNFNSLAFLLDNFYGLKEYYEIETFYDILLDNASGLLSKNPVVFENALGSLLLKVIDEPHTSYGYPSYYNKKTYEGYPTNSLGSYGPRFNAWYMDGFVAVNDAIEAKWCRHEGMSPNAWAAYSETRPKYWFLDDTHAVIVLDGFSTEDIQESETYDVAIVNKIMKTEETLLPAITSGDKFFFYNTSSKTNQKMEVIVKGSSEAYLTEYKQALVNNGYTYQFETSEDEEKATGYYIKEIQGVSYMVIVTFNQTHDVLYVGIMDNAPETYESSWPFYAKDEALIYNDSAVFMEFTLDKIFKEKPGVTHITLDITWNTGGNVGALYRVVGFITQEPFRTTRISADTNSKSTSFIQITGLPTYGPIQWSLLTSPLTFSAGNSMATIFKENNLGPVIGMTTGGGTSSITPVLLPNGSAFTMSSNSMGGYRTGAGTEADPYVYHINEEGIIPDHSINYSQFYDETKLLEILNSIS